VIAATLAAFLAASLSTAAGQPEPKRPHPRLLLDADLIAAWKKAARTAGNPVARAVARCDQIGRSPKEFDRDGYMGLDWGHHLQACLVAYISTREDRYAATAMRYFTAMIDDLVTVGDGKGGDQAARRDSGYAIRAMGPYSALAYDWLHDHKLMTETLRSRARQRFAAWTDWYLEKGYRARSPATNYQAGYLMAATFIAIAQAGEAGAAGAKLWRHVVDDLWRNDMTKAFAPGGVLDGGDWAEGWQYGPLSVAEYAVTLRVMRSVGVELAAARTWPVDLLRRHVHALAPSDRLFVGGDTQSEKPNIEPYMFGVAAIALSDAAPLDVRSHAVAEMDRLGLESRDFWLFDVLARGVGIKAVPVPRAAWPTWYVARGTSTLYARTRWDEQAVWTVMQCSRTLDVDHFQPNAGNFVISRGQDDLIVDPSPYGSLSTLTSNAPTVDSPQLPPTYRPGQAYWSERTGFRWAQQSQRGVVTARCDYADQYKFQHRPSDTPMAVRDFVLIPSRNGTDAILVIADRAETGSADRDFFARFRSPAPWQLDGPGVRAELGRSSVTLTTYDAARTKGTISSPTLRDCFGKTVTRGNCDAARFPVVDYHLRIRGPSISTTQVLEVGDRGAASRSTAISGTNYQGVSVARERGEAVVLWAQSPTGVRYQSKPGATVVVHDAVAPGATATVVAQRRGDGCELTIGAGRSGDQAIADPLILWLDDNCNVSTDRIATGGNAATGPGTAAMATTTKPAAGTAAAPAPSAGSPESAPPTTPALDTAPQPPRSPRSGCCGTGSSSGATLPIALLIGLALLHPRRRRS
jgi:uncharacterized protein (TIGR03382 family)